MGCLVLTVLCICVAWYVSYSKEQSRRQQLQEAEDRLRAARERLAAEVAAARAKYDLALQDLEVFPFDLARRKAALEAGRAWADIARVLSGQRGRTMFDEAEIQNDIAIRIGNSQVVAAAKRSHKCPNCAAPLVPEAKACRFCEAPVPD